MYVITAVPIAAPVTEPVTEPILATDMLLLLHVPPRGVPDKVSVLPTQILVAPVIEPDDALTVTDFVAAALPQEFVIV